MRFIIVSFNYVYLVNLNSTDLFRLKSVGPYFRGVQIIISRIRRNYCFDTSAIFQVGLSIYLKQRIRQLNEKTKFLTSKISYGGGWRFQWKQNKHCVWIWVLNCLWFILVSSDLFAKYVLHKRWLNLVSMWLSGTFTSMDEQSYNYDICMCVLILLSIPAHTYSCLN